MRQTPITEYLALILITPNHLKAVFLFLSILSTMTFIIKTPKIQHQKLIAPENL